MKQFEKLGAKCYKYAQRTLALGLVFCFLLSLQGTSVLAAENGELASLSLSGVSVIDFDPTVTDYTVKIPQTYTNGVADELTIPTVTAVPVDGAQVDIVRPATVEDGDITITVTPDGGISTVYTLSLEVVGKNLYENSGFEESGVPYNQQNGTATVVQTNPYSGSNCLEIKFKGDPGWMLPRVTLGANKTYLSSRMIRTTENTTQHNGANDIYYDIDSLSNATSTFYHYGKSPVTVSGTVARHALEATSDWHKYEAVITPGVDWEDKQMYRTGNWARINYLALDNCFLGELVVGNIEVTDVSGAALGKLVKPEEGTDSVSLGANFYNQLGTTAGLEGMTVTRWELAEDYAGVTLSDSGVLTYDITAPSAVTVRVYGTMGDNYPQSEVKGETELVLVDSSALVAAELEDITIGGFSIPGYQSSKSSYNMYIPYSYDALQSTVANRPAVVATPIFEGTTYTVSYPDTLNGGIIEITSTALDGTEKVYRIVMHTVGENAYVNSGFEADGIPYSTSATSTATKITENPGAGTYSLEVSFRGDLQGFVPRTTLDAGKTYLSSRMIRRTEKTVFNDSIPNEDPIFRLDGFNGSSNVYYGDEAIAYQQGYPITPADSWKTLNTIIKPTAEWQDKQMFHTAGWATTNWLAMDNCFLGELTVADIEYLGEARLAIPEQGSRTYPLSAKLKNQMGEQFGLLNETVNWSLVYPYQGVFVENGHLIISDEAREQTIRVQATVQPSFGGGYSVAKSFAIDLASESATAEFPRALDVYADGIVEVNQWLEGHYTYHNVKNIAESGTTFEWLYADTETGTQHSTGITTQNFQVTSDYVNKYLFFRVIPSTVEGKVGTPVTSNFLMKPVRPEVINLSITDGGYVGSIATGNYQFVDKNGDAESGSSYQWYRSATQIGGYTPITGATSRTYTVQEADINQYVCFEVMPKSAVVPTDGQLPAPRSTGVILAATPLVKNVQIHKVSGSVYRVAYDYEHPLNIAEGVCRVQWYIDGVAAGTEMSQTVGTGARKLSVVVTPVAAQPPYEGVAVTTQLAIASGGQLVGRVPSGGGGGGVSLGGGSKVVPVPEKTPEPVVNEPVKHWATDGIDFVMSRGIMQEPVPGDFCNARLVTRRDFIYYVMRTLGYQESAYNHEFQDVSGDDYYAGMLQTAVNEGIISKDEKFNPERNVSREEICKIIVLASELQGNAGNNLDRFADGANISEWARGYVGAAVETGLLKGVSETEFLPFGQVTREQTAVILKRLFDYKNGGALS